MTATALQEYVATGFKDVEGWLLPAALAATVTLDNLSRTLNVVQGGACEIGVHHGRYFLALLACTDPGQKSLAMDIFEDQSLNVDHSGRGSKTKFLENLKKYSKHSEDVSVVQADSLTMNVKKVADLSEQFEPFRFFSVDGGHTVVHALNDILIAQDLIANGGIVVVDDYFQQDWPTVTEGVARYFASSNARLAPLCIAGSKLFLTTFSYHARYMEGLRSALLENRPKSFAKPITVHGYASISFRYHPDDPIA